MAFLAYEYNQYEMQRDGPRRPNDGRQDETERLADFMRGLGRFGSPVDTPSSASTCDDTSDHQSTETDDDIDEEASTPRASDIPRSTSPPAGLLFSGNRDEIVRQRQQLEEFQRLRQAQQSRPAVGLGLSNAGSMSVGDHL